MKKTIVICDNCSSRMPEETKPMRIGLNGTKDFCSACLDLILNGRFIALQVLETRIEAMKRNGHNDRSTDIVSARTLIANAMEEWAEGKDPRATLTRAATRLAG